MKAAMTQDGVAEEVNNRLSKATKELEAKYASGRGGMDQSVDGPSGSAYKEKEAREREQKRRNREMRSEMTEQQENLNPADEDEDNDDGDEDYELRLIREQRLRQIKNEHNQKLENIGKGHGQYREISQDEFLAEVTSSDKVICHFYHRDFPRCEIMNHHLQILAQRHIEAKFIKINADKAPFFVDKLRVRMMPTLVIFADGVAADKIIGFEELCVNMPDGKEDEWPTVALSKLLVSKGAIKKDLIVDEQEIETNNRAKFESLRKAALSNLDDDFDDLDLDN